MKTFKFNATKTSLYINRLADKSALDQVKVLIAVNEILTDAFIATYLTESYSAAEKHDRWETTSLQNVLGVVLKDIIDGLVTSVQIGADSDWNDLLIHESVYDELVDDIPSYMAKSNLLISVFDNFYGEEARNGEVKEDHRIFSIEVRDFFLRIFGKSLSVAVDNGAKVSHTSR